jgi:hypothetical protein
VHLVFSSAAFVTRLASLLIRTPATIKPQEWQSKHPVPAELIVLQAINGARCLTAIARRHHRLFLRRKHRRSRRQP